MSNKDNDDSSNNN